MHINVNCQVGCCTEQSEERLGQWSISKKWEEKTVLTHNHMLSFSMKGSHRPVAFKKSSSTFFFTLCASQRHRDPKGHDPSIFSLAKCVASNRSNGVQRSSLWAKIVTEKLYERFIAAKFAAIIILNNSISHRISFGKSNANRVDIVVACTDGLREITGFGDAVNYAF